MALPCAPELLDRDRVLQIAGDEVPAQVAQLSGAAQRDLAIYLLPASDRAGDVARKSAAARSAQSKNPVADSLEERQFDSPANEG
jgi:hypothetical protein